jgi:hypothetical protein
MPGFDEYRCRSCNEETSVIHKYFCLVHFPEGWNEVDDGDQGRRDFQVWAKLHRQRFVCDPCALVVDLPRKIGAVIWRQWKREDLAGLRPHIDYPFLTRLVAIVDAALGAKSNTVMEFGHLACPYCSRQLVSQECLPPLCPNCGSSELAYIDGGIATMSKRWPPIV